MVVVGPVVAVVRDLVVAVVRDLVVAVVWGRVVAGVRGRLGVRVVAGVLDRVDRVADLVVVGGLGLVVVLRGGLGGPVVRVVAPVVPGGSVALGVVGRVGLGVVGSVGLVGSVGPGTGSRGGFGGGLRGGRIGGLGGLRMRALGGATGGVAGTRAVMGRVLGELGRVVIRGATLVGGLGVQMTRVVAGRLGSLMGAMLSGRGRAASVGRRVRGGPAGLRGVAMAIRVRVGRPAGTGVAAPGGRGVAMENAANLGVLRRTHRLVMAAAVRGVEVTVR